MAAKDSDFKILEKLLTCGFHVDHVGFNGLTAIDNAWVNFSKATTNEEKKESNKIILSLLNANSRFPSKKVKFDASLAAMGVQNHWEICDELHTLLSYGKIPEINAKINKHHKMCHFYDNCNQSLLSEAMKLQRAEMIKNCRLNFGPHEKVPVSDEKTHVWIVKSKIKAIGTNGTVHQHWTAIDDVLKLLNQSPTGKVVLQITSIWKNLKILFDFDHDLSHFRPDTKVTGAIYIGAKDLLDERKSKGVFLWFAKELTRLGIGISFMNNGKPYTCASSSTSKRTFEKIFTECFRLKDADPIIKAVFDAPPILIRSELILAAMEMELLGGSDKFSELLKYLNERVVKKMKESLPVLKMLQDKTEEVRFEHLTMSMRENVLRGDIIFQVFRHF